MRLFLSTLSIVCLWLVCVDAQLLNAQQQQQQNGRNGVLGSVLQSALQQQQQQQQGNGGQQQQQQQQGNGVLVQQQQQQSGPAVVSPPCNNCVVTQGDTCEPGSKQGDACCLLDGNNNIISGICADANYLILIEDNRQSVAGKLVGCFTTNYTIGIQV